MLGVLPKAILYIQMDVGAMRVNGVPTRPTVGHAIALANDVVQTILYQTVVFARGSVKISNSLQESSVSAY